MAILSITFHIEENHINDWRNYLIEDFIPHIHTLGQQFLLSDVDTEMLSEGKNTNLLLFFGNEEERETFINQSLPKTSQILMEKFGQNILIFKTLLNSLAKKL